MRPGSAPRAERRAAGENFPVASRVLPRAARSQLMDIYRFARLVDDTADEAKGDRMQQLEELERDLERIWSGAPRHPVVRRLARTVEHAATFRAVPGSGRLRAGTRTGVPGLFLAGAWTATGWPATMEGAVRGGEAAADAALGRPAPARPAGGAGRA
jgi:hypothetical protein